MKIFIGSGTKPKDDACQRCRAPKGLLLLEPPASAGGSPKEHSAGPWQQTGRNLWYESRSTGGHMLRYHDDRIHAAVSALGIKNAAAILWNMPVPALYEEAVRRREGLT